MGGSAERVRSPKCNTAGGPGRSFCASPVSNLHDRLPATAPQYDGNAGLCAIVRVLLSDCNCTAVQVGVVTSACQDAEGEWVGLGYVRSRVEGTQLQLEGGWTAEGSKGTRAARPDAHAVLPLLAGSSAYSSRLYLKSLQHCNGNVASDCVSEVQRPGAPCACCRLTRKHLANPLVACGLACAQGCVWLWRACPPQ